MKIKLHLPLSNRGTILGKNITTLWSPHFNAIVVYNHTKNESLTSENFLIVTGAAISILRDGLSYIFDFSNPIDNADIYFGNSKPTRFNVYKVTLKVKGVEFDILAAYKKNGFNNPYSLFGMTKGIDLFHHAVINPEKLDYKLIKKY